MCWNPCSFYPLPEHQLNICCTLHLPFLFQKLFIYVWGGTSIWCHAQDNRSCSRHVYLAGDPEADPRNAEEIISLSWPRNSLGPPLGRWRRVPGLLCTNRITSAFQTRHTRREMSVSGLIRGTLVSSFLSRNRDSNDTNATDEKDTFSKAIWANGKQPVMERKDFW